jgi:hypothetical protein
MDYDWTELGIVSEDRHDISGRAGGARIVAVALSHAV